MDIQRHNLHSFDVLLFSLGNLISYIPLSMMIRMCSEGLFSSLNGRGVSSFEILPLYSLSDIFVMMLFITFAGWWKYLNFSKVFGFRIPKIRWYIVISGMCIVIQIVTVLWIYAFTGISLVFAALLIKGGVLALAPAIDLIIKKRKIYWPSWTGAGLSLTALIVASMNKVSAEISLACLIDIIACLAVYFIRLLIMSKWAKTNDKVDRKRYIVEEQIVITIGIITMLSLMAFFGADMSKESPFHQVWRGVFVLPFEGFYVEPLLIGVFAAASGIFSSLLYLDRRENTFCVVAAQSTSVIAGTISTVLLAVVYGQPNPDLNKIVGVIILIFAIFFLVYRDRVEKRKNKLVFVS